MCKGALVLFAGLCLLLSWAIVDAQESPSLISLGRACEGDEGLSCHALGLRYLEGREGAAIDELKAAEFFSRACNAGYAQGCTRLGKMINDGTAISESLAVEFFQLGCDGGDPRSCMIIGVGNVIARGLPDSEVLQDHWECEKGDGGACYRLAVEFEVGERVPQSYEKAVDLFTMACEGEVQGCMKLGELYLGEGWLERDMAKAVDFYQLACVQEDAFACYFLGEHYATIEAGEEKAIAFYRLSCALNFREGCHAFGRYYREIEGNTEEMVVAAELTRQDSSPPDRRSCGFANSLHPKEKEASQREDWFDLDCLSCDMTDLDFEDVEHCFNCGVGVEKGIVIDKDDKVALDIYFDSCDEGYELACNNLAVMYEQGRGAEKDLDRAFHYYELACEGGVVLACNNLGVKYHVGEGVEQDDAMSASLLSKACEADNKFACYNLGLIYRESWGVKGDASKAAELFLQACLDDYILACKAYGLLVADEGE